MADFFEDVGMPELWVDHGRSPTKAERRRFCESFGYPWTPLSKELRRRQANAPGEPGELSYTPRGIEVRHGVIEAALDGLEPKCPWKLRFIDTANFQPFVYEKPCICWACPIHGPEKADGLLGQVEYRLDGLAEVHVAEVPWDGDLSNRMANRRHSRNLETFWYRNVRNRAFIIGDKPLATPRDRKEPVNSTPMTPAEVMAWVRPKLWVPGHHAHGWSAGWKFPSDDSQRGQKKEDDRYISVTELSDIQVVKVMARFREVAMTRFDVKVEEGYFPSRVHHALVSLLKGLIEAEKRRDDQREAK
jgi:hypothetical protein